MIRHGSEEWAAARATRLTASDFGAALGINPYCSRQKLWRIKVGLETVETNGHMQRGIDNEQEAIFCYEVETGLLVDEASLVLHPAHDWLAATPDGAVENDGLVEVKCPARLRDHVPEYHYAQVQGQLEVTGREFCDYFQFAEEGTSTIRVLRDKSWWNRAFPFLEEFWACVVSMEPPKRSMRKFI